MITYLFDMDDGRSVQFDVDPQRATKAERRSLAVTQPWTALSENQCENCPLSPEDSPACPPAVDVAEIVDHFKEALSIAKANVTVKTQERDYKKHTDIQTAIGSLFGLVMATSGCPMLSKFSGMAQFHLPFSSVEETVFRSVSSYLLKQHFVAKRGGEPDIELRNLRNFYEDLLIVNTGFLERVRAAAKRDANMNAVVLLFSVAALVGHSLDDGLAQLEELFG